MCVCVCSVQRGLVGEIISRFEKKGFKMRGLKMYNTPKEVSRTPGGTVSAVIVVS